MRNTILIKAKKFFLETFGSGEYPSKEEIMDKMIPSSWVPLNSKLIFSMFYICDLYSQEHTKRLEPYDLSISQLEILKILYFSKSSTLIQNELSKFTFTSKAAISNQISKLESKGFVKRLENTKNKREKLIKLTKIGEKKLFEVVENYELDVFEPFLSKEDGKEFIYLLEKLRKNMKEQYKNG